GSVDILINNAGISYRAVVEHMTEEDECRQMSTNYFGPLGLIRAVLPSMRERGRGKIINVSSVSGMLAMPTMSSYSASKYALEGASEALWYELKPYGLNISLVQPGFIHSKSFERVYYSKASHPSNPVGPYSAYYENMSPFVERMMRWARATPEKIAEQVLRVIKTENPPLWIPATADAYAFYYLRRFLPRRYLLQVLFNCLPRARRWGHGFTHRRGQRQG
ncbi:MAG: SDR family NAD(P)-dependent oxidoreductase, partial [Proteobacteria bacterium]